MRSVDNETKKKTILSVRILVISFMLKAKELGATCDTTFSRYTDGDAPAAAVRSTRRDSSTDASGGASYTHTSLA